MIAPGFRPRSQRIAQIRSYCPLFRRAHD
jgi:hypothetical protein